MLIYSAYMLLFVCVEAKRPRQQFFIPVGTEPPLPGYYHYFRGVKYLVQGHNTAVVGFEHPISRSVLRCPTLYHRATAFPVVINIFGTGKILG